MGKNKKHENEDAVGSEWKAASARHGWRHVSGGLPGFHGDDSKSSCMHCGAPVRYYGGKPGRHVERTPGNPNGEKKGKWGWCPGR